MLITPQCLLNGRLRNSFNSKKLTEQFEEASALIENGQITCVLQQKDDTVSMEWALKDGMAPEEYFVTVVLTESELTSKITGGENFGKTLVHNHVARAHETLKPEAVKGTVSLSVPADWKGTHAAVMVLLQNKDLQIVDYVRLPISKPEEAAEMTSLDQIIDASGVCTPDGCNKPEEMSVAADTGKTDSTVEATTATP